jgi:protein-S-isoprenylcysteine O-methyltransferase Ste14
MLKLLHFERADAGQSLETRPAGRAPGTSMARHSGVSAWRRLTPARRWGAGRVQMDRCAGGWPRPAVRCSSPLPPGTVAGFVPWWLTGWRLREPLAYWAPLRAVGIVLIAAGAAVLVHAFSRFVVEGLGTPAPVAPTARLVVSGLYRYVRNPMYLAVVAVIVGQALLLWQSVLLPYAAIVAVAFVVFVLGYEQPTLRRQFGSSYEAYFRRTTTAGPGSLQGQGVRPRPLARGWLEPLESSFRR